MVHLFTSTIVFPPLIIDQWKKIVMVNRCVMNDNYFLIMDRNQMMMSRNGEDESDMADVYENAENNFNINDIGVQRLEIRSSTAGVSTA